MMRWNFAFFLCICLLLSACQGAPTPSLVVVSTVEVIKQSQSIPTLIPYHFRTSTPGTVTLHGQLTVMDPLTFMPDANDAIFLAPLQGGSSDVTTIPSFKVGEVPQADVDESTGEFTFTDIQPGRYLLMVLTKGGSEMPARWLDQDSLAIINVDESEKGKTIELNHLRLP